MRLRYTDDAGMSFECADVAQQASVNKGEAELVVDKSTLEGISKRLAGRRLRLVPIKILPQSSFA